MAGLEGADSGGQSSDAANFRVMTQPELDLLTVFYEKIKGLEKEKKELSEKMKMLEGKKQNGGKEVPEVQAPKEKPPHVFKASPIVNADEDELEEEEEKKAVPGPSFKKRYPTQGYRPMPRLDEYATLNTVSLAAWEAEFPEDKK